MTPKQQRDKLVRLANDFQEIADEVGRKFGDSDALLVFKGVIIGIQRAAREIVDCPNCDEPDDSMQSLRDAVKRARGGESPGQHQGFA